MLEAVDAAINWLDKIVFGILKASSDVCLFV